MALPARIKGLPEPGNSFVPLIFRLAECHVRRKNVIEHPACFKGASPLEWQVYAATPRCGGVLTVEHKSRHRESFAGGEGMINRRPIIAAAALTPSPGGTGPGLALLSYLGRST